MTMNLRPAKSLCVALLAIVYAVPADCQSTGEAAGEKQAIIRRILEVTNAAELMLVAMETALPAQRASTPGVPAVFGERFAARARAERHTLVDSIVPVDDKAFTTEELKQLLQFYESPIGKRFVAVSPELARESMLAGQRWGMVLGQEVGAQLQREGVIPPPPPSD
jgi:hypothetical protein